MAGKPKNESLKQKAFAWLDGNASVLNREQLYDGLVSEFGLTLQTARVYASNWRKAHGVQRTYARKEPQANESNGVQRRYQKREELETDGN